MSEYKFTDNSGKVLDALRDQLIKGLETCGLVAEGYAKKLTPVDTGNLRNSISHRVDDAEPAVYIGTDVEYAPYIELGTGKYATTGGGTTKERWVYRAEDGTFHMGYPQAARPYLKPAGADHEDEYKRIIEDALKG